MVGGTFVVGEAFGSTVALGRRVACGVPAAILPQLISIVMKKPKTMMRKIDMSGRPMNTNQRVLLRRVKSCLSSSFISILQTVVCKTYLTR